MGAKGANYLSGALKVNTSLKELKCAACLLAHMTAPFQFLISFCPSCVLVLGMPLLSIVINRTHPVFSMFWICTCACACLLLAIRWRVTTHSFLASTQSKANHMRMRKCHISSATLTKPMPLLGWLDPPRCKLVPPTFDPVLMRGSTTQSPIPLFSFAAVSTTMTSTMKPKHNFKKRLAAHVSCFNSDSLAMLLPCFSAPTSQLESHMHDALGPVLWTFELFCQLRQPALYAACL